MPSTFICLSHAPVARALPARRSRWQGAQRSRAVGRLGLSFWQYLAPGAKMFNKEHPETHSSNIWRQAAKMLKLSILSIILAMSGPSTQHAENEAPDTHSGNIWAQAAKMLKMNTRAGKAVRLHTFETPSRGVDEKPREGPQNHEAQPQNLPGGSQVPGGKASWASYF